MNVLSGPVQPHWPWILLLGLTALVSAAWAAGVAFQWGRDWWKGRRPPPDADEMVLALIRESAVAGIEAGHKHLYPWTTRHALGAQVAEDTLELVKAGEDWPPAAERVLRALGRAR